ncbi:MAG: DNA topoisomerase VI subunit B [Candidatus Thermoplasmatota archaeon]
MTSAPIAEELAKKQKEISVAEFFERNKQLLGFDTLTRSLLTVVKECVDNSLDACEEARIMPEILVEVKETEKGSYKILVEDNGPGIVKKQIPPIFGRLLYGSRFYAIRQSRGQQGIGISAAVLYSQLSTGKPTKIISKIGAEEPAYIVELMIDTKKNMPCVLREDVKLWDKEHGTSVELEVKGRYVRGKGSIYDYIRSVAIVNPHANIKLVEPDGTTTFFERSTTTLPPDAMEIKPHPAGIEIGTLIKMAREAEEYKLSSFLSNEFSRVSYEKAKEICEKACLPAEMKPRELSLENANALIEAFKKVKFMAPPTDCLSPIGEYLIKKGIKKDLGDFEFITTVSRPPSVYSGNPFIVETGIAYGSGQQSDQPINILRFANRVPLLFQQGACCITHSIENIDWKRYGLEQRGSTGIPTGPATILVHVASTKIPFTSESKEAIADFEEIRNEIELALKECARKMQIYIRKKAKLVKTKEKEDIIKKILPLIAEKSASILKKPIPEITQVVAKIMNSILINDTVKYESGKHKINIEVVNYTLRGKNFELIVSIPKKAIIKDMRPKAKFDGDNVIWSVKIPTLAKMEYGIELSGLEEEEYESEIYVKDIDMELISGAELWGVKDE